MFDVEGYEIFEELRYIIELLAAQYMLTIPTELEKKENFKVNIIISSIILVAMSMLYFPILSGMEWLNQVMPIEQSNVNSFTWTRLIKYWYILLMLLSILNLKIMFKAKWSTLFFRTSLAWSIQHIEYAIINEWIGLGVLGDKRQSLLVFYIMLSIVSCALLYFMFYKIFIKLLKIKDVDNFKSKSAVILYAFYLLALVNFTFFCQRVFYFNHDGDWFYSAVIYDVLICVVFISGQYFMLRFSQNNLRRIQKERIYAEREKQYIQSQSTINFINKQVHDLKHQINGLKKLNVDAYSSMLEETDKNIKFYDSFYHTKNKVLDTLLTEKSLFADKNHIKLNVIADPVNVDFINELDLYILLGNILDNAIEATKLVEDKEKRIVSLTIKRRENFLYILETNYYTGEINIRNGKIQTSKADKEYHGYGLVSISDIAKKYKGIATTSYTDDIFTTKVLLPIPLDTSFA